MLLMFRKYYFDLNCSLKLSFIVKKKKEKKSLFLIQSLLVLFNHEYFVIEKKKKKGEFLFYINIIDNNIRPIVFSRWSIYLTRKDGIEISRWKDASSM